eukprot:gene10393-2525_t
MPATPNNHSQVLTKNKSIGDAAATFLRHTDAKCAGAVNDRARVPSTWGGTVQDTTSRSQHIL